MLIQEEQVAECMDELDALMHDYFEHTEAKQDVPPLAFQWNIYVMLNAQDLLKLYTARERGELIGFVMYHIQVHLHHMGHVNAACDTLAVRRDARGKGVGRQLMAYAEPRLKDMEVNFITHNFRTCYKTKPLFPKLGYKLVEYAYMKELN